jgi:hypothetical protein
VEDVVSGLLRSNGERREPRTPSFQTRLTPLFTVKKFCASGVIFQAHNASMRRILVGETE